VETILDRLKLWAEKKPERTFSTFLSRGSVEPITFEQLYRRSLAYARYYSAFGINRGDVVLIILQHTPHLFYSFLGAMLCGAIPSFMPFPTPKQRAELYWGDHEALFSRIEPKAIVTYESNARDAAARLPDFAIPFIIAGDDIFTRTIDDGHAALPCDVSETEIACLQHSSGTTSLKKGVMLSHRAIIHATQAYCAALNFGPSDSIAPWLPLYHDMGFIACFMTSIIEGTHLVALDAFEWTVRPQILLDAIATYRATFCWLPNFAFSHLVRTARATATYDLSSIRAFVNCSEPCKPETFDRFLHRFRDCGVSKEQLQVCYAMAENVFSVTQTQLGKPVRAEHFDAEAFSAGTAVVARDGASSVALLSCGTPVDSVSICIQDGSRLPADDGDIGEIHITSDFLFDGYYRLPTTTAERLREGWYATGDMGFILDDELFVTGRVDDMIHLNGRNYYAHELESLLNTIPTASPGRNIALSIHDAGSDANTLVVLVEARDALHVEGLEHEVSVRISEATGLAVHAVVVLAPGTLVKTTSGKISRAKNRELFVAGALKAVTS